MNELSLRPRSATELVDAALQVFRREPVQFILAAAIVYVPWALIQRATMVSTAGQPPDFTTAILNVLLGVAVYAVASGLVMAVAREVYLDGRPDLRAAGRRVVRRALPLIAVSLVVLVLVTIGFALFIVPAFLVLARFFAVRQVVLFEDAGVGGSISRSAVLSAGSKGHILATLLLSGLVVFLVTLGTGVLAALSASTVVTMVISIVVSVIIYPFLAIVETLLYFDMRIRKEGFDIEYLAAAGAPPGQAAGAAP